MIDVQEDKIMANTAVRTVTTIDATEMVRNHIEEHIQEKVGKIQEKKAAARGRLRRAISFLFECDSSDSGNLSPDMQAKLYL